MNDSVFPRLAGLSILLILGLFLAGTSGFDLLPELGVYNGKRIIEVTALALLLSITSIHAGLRDSFGKVLGIVPGWVFYSLLLAASLGIISAMRLQHPAYGLIEVAMLALIVLAAIGTAAARNSSGDSFDRLAMLAVCITGLMVIFTELVGLIAALMLGSKYHFDKMLIRFFHPRFFNQLQTFSIPLIAALPFVFRPSRKLVIAAIALIGLHWSLVLISGGRGTAVSVVAALVLAALLFPSNRRSWLGIQLAGLALGATLFFSVLHLNDSLAPDSKQIISQSIDRPLTETTGRTHMWEISWNQALTEPFLGIGPSRYACGLHQTSPAHPHSFPFTVLAEWGFPAFILIALVGVWLLGRLIVYCRRMQDGNRSSDVLVAMLGCSLLAGAVHSTVSGVLIMPASQVMAILVGGWALGRLHSPGGAAPVPGRLTTLVLAAAMITALSVSTFSVIELRKMDYRTGDQMFRFMMEPRYWQWGRSCEFRYDD